MHGLPQIKEMNEKLAKEYNQQKKDNGLNLCNIAGDAVLQLNKNFNSKDDAVIQSRSKRILEILSYLRIDIENIES